jgi:hypothetical protein
MWCDDNLLFFYVIHGPRPQPPQASPLAPLSPLSSPSRFSVTFAEAASTRALSPTSTMPHVQLKASPTFADYVTQDVKLPKRSLILPGLGDDGVLESSPPAARSVDDTLQKFSSIGDCHAEIQQAGSEWNSSCAELSIDELKWIAAGSYRHFSVRYVFYTLSRSCTYAFYHLAHSGISNRLICAALLILNLSETAIRDSGLQVLSSALRDNSVLTSLKLSKCEIGDSGAHACATALRGNRTLTLVDLSDNHV